MREFESLLRGVVQGFKLRRVAVFLLVLLTFVSWDWNFSFVFFIILYGGKKNDVRVNFWKFYTNSSFWNCTIEFRLDLYDSRFEIWIFVGIFVTFLPGKKKNIIYFFGYGYSYFIVWISGSIKSVEFPILSAKFFG